MRARHNIVTGPFRKEDLIYIAGFLDGEGSFVCPTPGQIRICTSNSYRPILEWAAKTFGGVWYKRSIRKNHKAHHKPMYDWSISGNQCKYFCEQVLPFLKEKQNQAKMLIKIQSLPRAPSRRHGLPNEFLIERKKLFDEIKTLKHIHW